jgi:hypothetical protein
MTYHKNILNMSNNLETVINNFDFSKEEPMHIDSNQWKNQNNVCKDVYDACYN